MDIDAAKYVSRFSFDDFENKFCNRVIAEMEKNKIGNYKTADWANISLSDEIKANIIAFHSGWGDGGYASYWGIDKNGNQTSLITDFDLFYSEK